MTSDLFFGTVRHKRLFPKINAFSYGIYYLSIPLSDMANLPLAHNRMGWISFYDKDHGACDGSDLQTWARGILQHHAITQADGEIVLVCMPKIMGYVFNPVSFWLCYDSSERLRAVLCEVHNTFGERHTYLCAHPDQSVIESEDVIQGQKVFHVSPFLKRAGHYTFRFNRSETHFSVNIDFYDNESQRQLVTGLTGVLAPMDKATLRKTLWRYPLVTFKAMALIHWQALKLLSKGIRYIAKPKQHQPTISTASNITEK